MVIYLHGFASSSYSGKATYLGERLQQRGVQFLAPDLNMPVLVFQGRRDTAVDPAAVEAWCRRRPNVELHMLDDDHQLTASLGYIWEKLAGFLRVAESIR